MLVLSGTRKAIFEALAKAKDETVVLLKVKPSALLVASILNQTKAKKIICSEGIWKTFTKKMISALSDMGIVIEVTSLKNGRPYKFDEKDAEKGNSLINGGKTVKEAAKELKMSERALYYWLKRMKKRESATREKGNI